MKLCLTILISTAILMSCASAPVAKQAPLLVNEIKPDYCSGRPGFPRKAAAEGVSGWVLLAFDINDQGQAQKVEVLDASPAGYFENAAIGLIQTCTFSHRINRVAGKKYQYLANYKMK